MSLSMLAQDHAVGAWQVAGLRGHERRDLARPVDAKRGVERQRELDDAHDDQHQDGYDEGELEHGLTALTPRPGDAGGELGIRRARPRRNRSGRRARTLLGMGMIYGPEPLPGIWDDGPGPPVPRSGVHLADRSAPIVPTDTRRALA